MTVKQFKYFIGQFVMLSCSNRTIIAEKRLKRINLIRFVRKLVKFAQIPVNAIWVFYNKTS